MAISGVGSIYSYNYNLQTKRLSLENGQKDDEFVSYYNDELKGVNSDYLNGYDKRAKDFVQGAIERIGWLYDAGLTDKPVADANATDISLTCKVEDSLNTSLYINGEKRLTLVTPMYYPTDELRSFDRINTPYKTMEQEGNNQEENGREYIGKATSRTTSSDKGKNIGIMTIGSKGFIAKYADSSTAQDPVIKVGNYEVRVNDVDPENATEIEMFALMSYMDDNGLMDNHGMKSFNKMRAYSQQAEYNGFCSNITDSEIAWTRNRDWIAILESAKKAYYKLPQAYQHVSNCQSIIEGLMRWYRYRT